MQQKTDGHGMLRLLTKHVSAEDQALEQWFLVAIGDDKATNAVAKSANANASIEVVGHIPAATLATWSMTGGRGSACSSG